MSTRKAQAAFLRVFAECGIVLHACRDAKVGRQTVYDWLEKDERFATLYAQAEADAIDLLEAEARRRAVEGWIERPIHDKEGKHIGDVKRFSDTLLLAKLKAKKPEYRDKYEVSGNMTVAPADVVTLLNEGRKRAREAATSA